MHIYLYFNKAYLATFLDEDLFQENNSEIPIFELRVYVCPSKQFLTVLQKC